MTSKDASFWGHLVIKLFGFVKRTHFPSPTKGLEINPLRGEGFPMTTRVAPPFQEKKSSKSFKHFLQDVATPPKFNILHLKITH